MATFYLLADGFIFQPPPATYQDQDNPNIIKLTLPSGKKISAIHMPNKNAAYTILLSHGNAEDLGSLLPFLQLFYQQGFSIISFDYQGYGTSEGTPSEKNSYAEITAVYHYLTQTAKVKPEHIILYGRSLGSGPSIYLASLFPVKALVLESPFVSAFRIITIISLFPFDKYPNLSRLQNIKIPILVIHGKNDKVIPLWHGKKIFASAKGYKEAYFVEKANHNDVLYTAKEAYWQTLQRFVKKIEQVEQ